MDDLAIREQESSFVIQAADLSKNDLPSLEDAQELPIDLCGKYWTPEKPGEFRKMYFVEIKPQKVLSVTSPDELIDLDCATFLEKSADGTVQTVTNGSRILVGILEQYIENGSLKSGMPLKITYMGKRKNKTNNFQSDNWSVKPLRINLPVAG
ncbi:hypothetical protein [Bacteroides thetaiotaomicron]|uniref:hypothetical protein n=1 Tax=Bacteroides thetaiotaomicron TaxID=818 RepID=UPI0021660A0D|nr:hypothetical protein [Bacteroides thetaiotaomicron]MCS2293093.1 hypothetical protein [Bacteroides thetaiotaomicron]